MPVDDSLPYCGPPPRPAELAGSWNLDPALLAVLALVALAYVLGARRAAIPLRARAAFAGGMVALVAAFVSPLCSLGVALFSARVFQHLLLALAAAPLLVMGRPLRAAGALLGIARPHRDRRGAAASPALAGGCFAVVLWLWHAPAPYAATLRDDGIYWLMHLSLLGAAAWLWQALLGRGRREAFGAAALAFATSAQMGLLGALLAVAPRPLYPDHLATTAAWGLAPLADQALGGLFCWVPGCAVFAAVGLLALSPWLRTATEGGSPLAPLRNPAAPPRG